MTVQEMYDQLGRMLQQQPRIAEHEVCVYTDDRGLSGFNIAKVSSIGNGFDWYNGKLLIHTEKNLITRPK